MGDQYKPVQLNVTDEIAKAKLTRPGFTEAWDALEEEYSALSALITARKDSGLTQEDLAVVSLVIKIIKKKTLTGQRIRRTRS